MLKVCDLSDVTTKISDKVTLLEYFDYVESGKAHGQFLYVLYHVLGRIAFNWLYQIKRKTL